MDEARLDALAHDLRAALPTATVTRRAALGPLTTFRLGGPADVLVTVSDEREAVAVLSMARTAGVPIVPIGGGSNVLVSDAGVRGVVLRFHGGDIHEDVDGTVRVGAGVTINGLVRWLIGHGLAGLEAWAGTPGTVGGAIFGNAHFQGRLISESVVAVRLLEPDGAVADVAVDEMAFAYDYSRLHATGEIVVSARFAVSRGDPDTLRATARASLAFRKRTQPLHLASAGCIFQNPSRDTALPAGIPRSAGALVDRAGLKGAREGGVTVSPVHANFMTAERGASARDVRALIDRCRDAVATRFGVQLHEEIVYVGDWNADHSRRHS